MIQDFNDEPTRRLFREGKHRDFANIAKPALRKLLMIETATKLDDLRDPPGNHLEALKGDRSHQHSIRINDQYRICFLWKPDGAYEVEITDYH